LNQYKSSYDLLSQAPTSSVPIRQTRRAHTERLQLLKGDVGPASSGKSKPEVPISHPQEADIWDILATAKGKKEKEKPSQSHYSSTAPPRKERKLLSTSRAHVSSASGDLRLVAPMSSSRLSASKQSQALTPSLSKRKKSDAPSPALGVDRLNGESSSSARRRTDSFSTENKTRLLPIRNAAPRHLTTPHPQTTIKRIKLLVRLPPPTFSHPRQRPPVPKFGGSLQDYLSSYTTVGDKDLYDPASVENFVKAEAAIHDRIAALKSSGRLLFASKSTSEGVSRIDGRGQYVPLADPWSRTIDAIVMNGKIKKVDGKSIAAQIAGKIKVYWDTFAAREDRARLMEEKRLRAMAKSTVRLVVAEWKKVVFVSLSYIPLRLYSRTAFC
jgi:helicase SWR1